MAIMPLVQNAQILGDSFNATIEQSYGAHAGAAETVGPAKTGALTTRTSASVGTLTMDSGHGFITADLIDLFWTTAAGVNGARRAVVVGTVATNSVPITGGSGDDLPDDESAITAMVPHEETVVVTGDNVALIVAKSDRPGFIVLCESDDTVIAAIRITGEGAAYVWYLDSGADNPLAGVSVGKILTSHDDSEASHAPKCIIGYN